MVVFYSLVLFAISFLIDKKIKKTYECLLQGQVATVTSHLDYTNSFLTGLCFHLCSLIATIMTLLCSKPCSGSPFDSHQVRFLQWPLRLCLIWSPLLLSPLLLAFSAPSHTRLLASHIISLETLPFLIPFPGMCFFLRHLPV